MPMINIIIADDHKIFRQGIASIIEDEGDMNIIGQVGDGSELIELLKKNNIPDIILMDIDMGDMDGIKSTSFVKTAYPIFS